MKVNVIGAGLAGSEAAWCLANRGIKVHFYEMRPKKFTPVHQTEYFAELVCSNSLRSNELTNAVGLLKEELRFFGSLIMEAADKTRVPAGSALAVDREAFSKYITEKIKNHPNIIVINEEYKDIKDEPTIIATGPLTSDELSLKIKEFIGAEYLSFFDAAAPIIYFDSIDLNKTYFKSRYDKGDADYLNCPMTKEEYERFYEELINAECAELKEFEKDLKVFEGCIPIEILAKRGKEALLFGPLKPVGLEMPEGSIPYAVVQLRQDNAIKSLYNMVGFQTNLKWGEQKRIFRLIPGLEKARFARYGVMHKNIFINSPKILNKFYQIKNKPNIFFAGQITGVEGYVESAGSGLVAGINMARYLKGEELIDFSKKTMIGALAHYISSPVIRDFQPMNANYGLLEELNFPHKKKDRKKLYAERSINICSNLRKL